MIIINIANFLLITCACKINKTFPFIGDILLFIEDVILEVGFIKEVDNEIVSFIFWDTIWLKSLIKDVVTIFKVVVGILFIWVVGIFGWVVGV